MGAAFITHIVMNQLRSSDVSPFGRYELPDHRTLAVGAMVILAPITAVEATYFISGPDSLESNGGPSGDWLVEGNFGSEQLSDGIEYVNDGDTLAIDMHTDSVSGSENLNVVGVRVTLQYSEDESTSGFGCGVPGASNSEPDTITGTISNAENNGSSSGQNSGDGISSHLVEVEWFNGSLIGNVSGLSKSDIIDGLEVGDSGLGPYVLEISVTAETGGSPGCSHSDSGEEVEYLVELITLEYTIESA
jgi:hypothetical protein